VANKFDPYREALVLETKTIWPDDVGPVEASDKQRIAAKLHADPQSCANLEYVRLVSGFCRQITVTQEDLERVKQSGNAATTSS